MVKSIFDQINISKPLCKSPSINLKVYGGSYITTNNLISNFEPIAKYDNHMLVNLNKKNTLFTLHKLINFQQNVSS